LVLFKAFIGLPLDSIYKQKLQAIDWMTNTFDILLLFTFAETTRDQPYFLSRIQSYKIIFVLNVTKLGLTAKRKYTFN